jgi:hypothetical protein
MMKKKGSESGAGSADLDLDPHQMSQIRNTEKRGKNFLIEVGSLSESEHVLSRQMTL